MTVELTPEPEPLHFELGTTLAPIASQVRVNASGFDGNLDTDDDTVQKVAQKLDDLEAAAGGAPLSDDDPEALGAEAPGVSTSASRADHVHPMPTAADVGALPADTVIPPAAPVDSVNGQTGEVVLSASDVGALPDDTVIPPAAPVDSVNGQTGVVVLSASDVGALPDDTVIPPAAPVDSVNGETGTVVLDAGDVGAEPAGTVTAFADTLGTAAFADSTDFATAAQGGVADSAVQPGDLATVATSGQYGDLTGRPTLGTAAAAATTDFATAAQGTDERTPLDNSVTSAKIANGTIVDEDISASAAIAQSKVSGLTTDLAGKAPATATVGTALGTSGTVDLDFATLNGSVQWITATGALTFTTSNRAAGRTVRLFIDAGGSSRTLAWPAWTAVGAALPTSLPSGKRLAVSLLSLGTTDANITAAAAVQP